MLDTIMLRLRTADGLDMREFGLSYGQEAAQGVIQALWKHVESGRVQFMQGGSSGLPCEASSSAGRQQAEKQGVPPLAEVHRIRLSDPLGFLVSNSIISDIFAHISRTVP